MNKRPSLTKPGAQTAKFTFYALGALLVSAVLFIGRAESAAEPHSIVRELRGNADAGYARAIEPMAFEFPRDHGPHPEYKIEWWYYTGNLKTEDGEDFGYQLTFFRNTLTPDMPARRSNFAANQTYMAHFALTDVNRRRHLSFERFSRGAGGLAGATGDPTYEVWLEDWSAKETGSGVMHLAAVDDQTNPRVAIDLKLRQTRPPVLHGNAGLSQKGPEPGNANYYYSMVGLRTTGTVVSHGETMTVTGISWMDHEFGTSTLSADVIGWDWFGLQLDNGVALMFGKLREKDGGSQDVFEGTLAYPDGQQAAIGVKDFTLTTIEAWTSAETGVTYPVGWEVTLPRFDLHLRIEPFIPDQELQGAFVYWEGAVRIQGTMSGEPISGRGYVELTGYGE